MRKLYVSLFGLLLATPLYAGIETTCTSHASDTEKCLYFFKGYLYGLGEVTKNNAESTRTQPGDTETFFQRAVRTRLGVEKARQSGANEQASYCLPEQTGLAAIARQLQATLVEDTARWNEENDPLLAALEHTFPC